MKGEALSGNLNKFCELILSLKKYQFDEGEIDFEYSELIKEGIVELTGDTVRIANADRIVSVLLPHFQEIFRFEFSPSAKPLKRFINKATKYFPNEVLMGRTAFNTAFRNLCVKRFCECGGDIILFGKLHSKLNGDIYDFQDVIKALLPQLEFTPSQILELFDWLYEEVKAEDPNVIDGNTASLGNMLSKACMTNENLSKELYILSFARPSKLLKPFHSIILATNLSHSQSFLTQLEVLYKDKDNQAAVVGAMSILEQKQEHNLRDYITLIESTTDYSIDCLKELPRFYITILQCLDKSDTVSIRHCLDKISFLLFSYPELTSYVLFQMSYVTDYIEEIINILIKFISEKDIPDHFPRMLNNIFLKHGTASYFFKVISSLASKQKSQFDPQEIRSTISVLYSQSRGDFEKYLIKMLIDDSGFVRFAAMRIMNSLVLHKQLRAFLLDLLELSTIEQYKVVLSITDDFHEPKFIVPFITPLLDSPSLLVVELTLHKLQVLTENYFNDVIKSLNACLNLNKAEHIIYLKRIEDHYKNFKDPLNKKWQIKELDPRYIQSNYYLQYIEQNQKNMREALDKSVKKNSFLSILGGNDVMLGKGGGFQMGQQKEVRQLSTIRSTMSLPREYFVDPEGYDWQNRARILSNWNNLLKEWEAIL